MSAAEVLSCTRAETLEALEESTASTETSDAAHSHLSGFRAKPSPRRVMTLLLRLIFQESGNCAQGEALNAAAAEDEAVLRSRESILAPAKVVDTAIAREAKESRKVGEGVE